MSKENEKVKCAMGYIFGGYIFVVILAIVSAIQFTQWNTPKSPKAILDLTQWECKQVKQVYGKLQCINWELRQQRDWQIRE